MVPLIYIKCDAYQNQRIVNVKSNFGVFFSTVEDVKLSVSGFAFILLQFYIHAYCLSNNQAGIFN